MDHIVETETGFNAIVEGRTFGEWRSRREAVAGMVVEQRRAIVRRRLHAAAIVAFTAPIVPETPAWPEPGDTYFTALKGWLAYRDAYYAKLDPIEDAEEIEAARILGYLPSCKVTTT